MRIHLINPSDVSFGVAVITPRWLYVLAAATPRELRRPAPHRRDAGAVRPVDRSNGRRCRHRHPHGQCAPRLRDRPRRSRAGAFVVFGGIHSTLYPDEAREHGGAHAVVRGDGDLVWAQVVADCAAGRPQRALRGRTRRGTIVLRRPLGPAPEGPLHVGIGPDRARLPEALFVLLGVAHRRPAAAHARQQRHHRGGPRAAPTRFPLRAARRRQLLSRHAERPRHGAAPGRSDGAAAISRRFVASASS